MIIDTAINTIGKNLTIHLQWKREKEVVPGRSQFIPFMELEDIKGVLLNINHNYCFKTSVETA